MEIFIDRSEGSARRIIAAGTHHRSARIDLLRSEHQLHKLFRDLRLESLGVTLVEAHDIGDHAALWATRVHIHLRGPRTRL
jgi:hypothetical protein